MCFHVALWHLSDMALELGDVRYWMNSGKHVLTLSFSVFDPNVWSGRALQEVFVELAFSGLASMYPVSDWS